MTPFQRCFAIALLSSCAQPHVGTGPTKEALFAQSSVPASRGFGLPTRVIFGHVGPPIVIDGDGRALLGLHPQSRVPLGFDGQVIDVTTLINGSNPGSAAQICVLTRDKLVQCMNPWNPTSLRRLGPFPAAVGVSAAATIDVCVVEPTRMRCLIRHIDSATNLEFYEPTVTPFQCTDGRCLHALHKGIANAPAGPFVAWDTDPRSRLVCGVLANGHVQCTGDDFFGQLGDGQSALGKRTAEVQGIADAVDVAVGMLHACALRQGGQVSCWGAMWSPAYQPASAEHIKLQNHPICAIDVPKTKALRVENAEKDRVQVAECVKMPCTGLDCHLGCVPRAPPYPVVWIHSSPCEEVSTSHDYDLLQRALPKQSGQGFSPIAVDLATDVVSIGALELDTCMVRKSGTVDCFGGYLSGSHTF